MALYITRQFDEIDEICWRYYGRTEGTVEPVLEANPGLSDMLPILPGDVAIDLPELPEPTTRNVLRIWTEA
ncbi:tail protein X [Synechococcus elongatus]|uniref:Uncharacterized protein n=2 Tax=Synechococcus elongatus TaxID=32046 RepID=Q31Q85_SYNE7|nr:tail protein X [Synechococcus elongatus]ABB56784.1 conserved hypothetical protein [Synechococcus elongatus PCC 7942 = FACHB-805]AJD58675.1 tail protein [Synechococcus elongatus UTEX 2973]MBD2588649.1 tail protein X [Synechococcus elongatus FACHB-242]MBD2689762.1 tail protein X [Synechococcus elongatus FACHB-1061]MBD2708369.1 tail protein X [Synechococcus elongatus PCC 7942 = FACHB-805]